MQLPSAQFVRALALAVLAVVQAGFVVLGMFSESSEAWMYLVVAFTFLVPIVVIGRSALVAQMLKEGAELEERSWADTATTVIQRLRKPSGWTLDTLFDTLNLPRRRESGDVPQRSGDATYTPPDSESASFTLLGREITDESDPGELDVLLTEFQKRQNRSADPRSE